MSEEHPSSDRPAPAEETIVIVSPTASPDALASESDVEPEGATLRQRTVRGGAYLVGRQAIAVVLKLIGIMLITRVLGPTQYGAYVSANNVYQYALLLGQAGIGIYLLRYPGEIPEKVYRTTYTLLLVMALTLSLALTLARGPLAAWTGVPGFSAVLLVMSLALPFQLLTIPATVSLERTLIYKRIAVLEIGGDVIYYALAAAMVLSGFGAVSLGVAYLIQQLMFVFVAAAFARRVPRFGFDPAIAREIVRYAADFSFANWVWQLRMLVNPLIAAPVLGARAVGLIGMTVGILEMLSIIKTIAWRLSVSVLGRIQHEREKLRRAVTEGMELQTLAVGAILLGFGWFGTFVVPLVFGRRWAPVMDFFPYIAVSYLSVAMFNVHSAVISIIDRNRALGLCFVVHVLLFAGTTAVAIRHLGPIGYGVGEIAGLPVYLLMHRLLASEVGSPDYRNAAVWWAAAVVGLFWKELGLWAIAVPFLALALPRSRARLRDFIGLVMTARRKEALA